MSEVARGTGPPQLPPPYYAKGDITLYHGDCLAIMAALPDECIDMVFADPPYMLSNGGVTCHAGRMVSVDKGAWDRSGGAAADHEFVCAWLSECLRVMKPDATIWVSGTHHIVFSVGFAMQKLGFKILNDIAWYKINPPPNLSCRYFTHATETIIWAARTAQSRHTFNYAEMKATANEPFDTAGKQMKSAWAIPPPGKREKTFGKHPTQKPVQLLNRILRASTKPGDHVLDPFVGAGTTAVAARVTGRACIGIDSERDYLQTAALRLEESDTLRRLRELR